MNKQEMIDTIQRFKTLIEMNRLAIIDNPLPHLEEARDGWIAIQRLLDDIERICAPDFGWEMLSPDARPHFRNVDDILGVERQQMIDIKACIHKYRDGGYNVKVCRRDG